MEKAHVGTWCALALLASSMLAQGKERAWTPGELVAQALANNVELQSYEQGVAAARGERMQAGFFRNPEVSLEVGGREVRDPENILQGNGTTFNVSVMQTLE